jgi:tetratricopeptide (TPR) repeat protein
LYARGFFVLFAEKNYQNMRNLFLLLITLLPCLAYAQVRTEAWTRDSIKIDKIIKNIIGKRYEMKPDSIKYYAQEALDIAEAINYAHGKAMAHCYLGFAAEVAGYYPLAEAEYLKRLQIRQEQPKKDLVQITWAYMDLLYLYKGLEKEKEFMEVYKQVMKLADKLPIHIATYNLIDGMQQHAIAFYNKADQYEIREKYHKKRIEIAQKYKHKVTLYADVLPAFYVELDRLYYVKTHIYKEKKQDIRKVLDERMKNAPNLTAENEGFAYRAIMLDAQATNNIAYIKKVYRYAQKRFLGTKQYEQCIMTSMKAYHVLPALLDKFQVLEDVMAITQKYNLTKHTYRFPANYNAWLDLAKTQPSQEKAKLRAFLQKWEKKQTETSKKNWAEVALKELSIQ